MKWFLSLLLAGAVAATGYGVWRNQAAGADRVSFRTAPVERIDLAATISATGTLEPEEVVDVGAQVAGMIKSLGTDPQDSKKAIDYGARVEDGTVLAQIDEALYQAQVEQAKAQLAQAQAGADQAQAQVEQAQANLRRAEADLQQMKAKVYQTERDWDRARRLGGTHQGVLSDTDYDTAQAAYETAKSALGVGEAAIAQAQAALKDSQAAAAKARGVVGDAEANLKKAAINLGYCTIRSPVKGVIVDRRVNIGQTVVASLNAPSLFLIAKDLTRMQIWAAVNEADIGQIHPGQAVRFTVDAYPNETFHGTVSQIRLNATMTQNVVTYTVVITTDNSSGKLLPYLTANVLFEVDRRGGVLTVPNGALRWQPTPQQIAPEARAQATKEPRPGTAGGTPPPGGGDHGRPDHGTVWVVDGNVVRPVAVKVGLSDGVATEVSGEGLAEGDRVVTGTVQVAAAGDAASPFAPKLFGGKKQ